MSEKHTHEEKPWSPTIDRDQLLNPFANPQDGQPQNPVHMIDEEEDETNADDEAAGETISSDDPAVAPKPAE
jgi:hypothetical protein